MLQPPMDTQAASAFPSSSLAGQGEYAIAVCEGQAGLPGQVMCAPISVARRQAVPCVRGQAHIGRQRTGG